MWGSCIYNKSQKKVGRHSQALLRRFRKKNILPISKAFEVTWMPNHCGR
jgi:hypothetical protein